MKENQGIKFTRRDFLSYDYQNDLSIVTKGNNRLFERLKALREAQPNANKFEGEVAKWSEWKDYPNFERSENMDLTQDKDDLTIHFFAWLLHTFVRCICECCYHSSLRENGLRFIKLDEVVFIFLQVQHNIDKWNLLEQAYETNKIPRGKEDRDLNETEKKLMKEIDAKGYEFPNGAGVAGVEGERRRAAITKRLFDLFYDPAEQHRVRVNTNRVALVENLKSLMEEEENKLREAGQRVPGEQDSVAQPKKKKARKQTSVDEKMDSITQYAWSLTDGVGLGLQAVYEA